MRRKRQPAAEGCDVLVICTGNICRSPMAASMLAAALPGLRIASAGTGAVVGAPPHEHTRTVLAAHGVPVLEHRARQLTAPIAGGSGLIVAMTRKHRTKAFELGGRAYTAHELARLVGPDDGGSAADVAGLVEARLRAETVDHDDPDVADPIGLPLEAYERCFDDLAVALAPLVRALG